MPQSGRDPDILISIVESGSDITSIKYPNVPPRFLQNINGGMYRFAIQWGIAK
jgi:predicted alternative tryptophan synthase beta-subunit